MSHLRVNAVNQRGAALLVLFLIIFAVSTTMFLSSVNTHAVEVRQFNDTRAEMESAKQALIAYAMNYQTFGFDRDGDTYTDDAGPGRMPCPDTNNDGDAEADCTGYVRGRLPTSADFGANPVVLNNTYVNIDQQFWYVLSPSFRELATSYVNDLTAGDLTIDGEGGFVAVIIAPGEALAGQDRVNAPTAAANYLEQDNIAGADFINYYPADPEAFNDQVIGIKASELMISTLKTDAINSTSNYYFYESARQQLNAYYTTNGTLPDNATTLNAYMKDKGYGWLIDEGYMPSSIYLNYYRNSSYPYVRYNLKDCTSYWYWFIPVYPYSPSSTYVSGTPC